MSMLRVFDSDVDRDNNTINGEIIPDDKEFKRRLSLLYAMHLSFGNPYDGYNGWKKSST